MITFPNAKINLGLNVTEKRPDGYHNLETIFYPVPLSDALEIIEKPNALQKITLHSSGIQIESAPEDNLIAKAYNLLDKDFDLPSIEAYIYKHIPSGAGLGGGSSDAAFMLKLLNNQFNLALSDDALERYAAVLGADCAFFIKNKTAFAEGIGNQFTPISLSLKGYKLVINKPEVFVSTRDAFSKIKPQKPSLSLKEIITYPISDWQKYMINDFEESVFSKHPVIGEIKENLYKQGALYASMSGSGSSVFGLFESDAIITEVDCKTTNKSYVFTL